MHLKVGLVFLFLSLFSSSYAQQTDSTDTLPPVIEEDCDEALLLVNQAPNVFLDCSFCDSNFIRDRVSYVNYVRDKQVADIHLLVTSMSTGSGGRTYTLAYYGLEDFEGLSQTLEYTSSQDLSRNEVLEGLSRTIELGLVPYLAQTPLAAQLQVQFNGSNVEKPVVVDPWNNWVFEVNGSGYFEKEASRDRYRWSGSFSADRVTETWRIRSQVYTNEDVRRFDTDDGGIESTQRRAGAWGSIVRSISDHWSLGYSSSANTSTYTNLDLSISTGPAVEFNVFPYTEATRREFTFAYRMNYRFQDYTEITVFDKTKESLVRQSLEARLRLKEKWGETSASIEGSSYLHDPSKNRIEFSGQIRLRVAKGLSLRLSSGLELIHDQLYLEKGDASLEDVLLQQRQLATTYEVRSSIGLSYTFGSIYNNVVNTRL